MSGESPPPPILRGYRVIEVSVHRGEFRFTFEREDQRALLTAMTIVRHIGDASERLDPNADANMLGGALAFLDATVASAWFDAGGTLHLAFQDGTALSAPPDDRVESWALQNDAGYHVICTPDGALFWDKRDWSGTATR